MTEKEADLRRLILLAPVLLLVTSAAGCASAPTPAALTLAAPTPAPTAEKEPTPEPTIDIAHQLEDLNPSSFDDPTHLDNPCTL